MANKVRGEVDVELGGKKYTLRLDYTAMATIEAETKTGLIALLRAFNTLDVRMTDVVTIIWVCANRVLKEEKQPLLEYGTVGEKVLEEGFKTFLPPLTDLLLRVLVGPKTDAPTAGEEIGAAIQPETKQ